MAKLTKTEESSVKSGKKSSKPVKTEKAEKNNEAKNKYEKLTNKKRKLNDSEEPDKENKTEPAKKPRLETKSEDASKPKKILKAKKSPKDASKIKKFGNGVKKTDKSKPATPVDKKELLKQRKQKKMAENYDLSINMKKIWETLRRSETTEETKKKLCSSLYDQVKTRVKNMSFAHDTVRVIECLVQYGNEKHRAGVFEELKDDFVDLSKSKYGRFLLKKILAYGTKEQKDAIITAFTGHVTKLIKHSFACQIVEALYNEHANFAQRNQMLMEFYDPTFAILSEQKCKSLAEVLEAKPFLKESILENVKQILISCIDKTILMFSIIHRVFLEFLQNCDQKQKAEIVDLLSEHLVHMVHTKDGANVAMQCIWFSPAKDRKKILKAMKSFIVKMAKEEHGHMVLCAVFDSVDDTKLVSKGILEEMFRSVKEIFDSEYGRKVVTYLIASRDSRFFIKDYVKKLEQGDSTETSKKDPEKRRAELFDYAKKFILDYFNKEIKNLFNNGPISILVPLFFEKLDKEGDELMEKIAELVLEKPYEPLEADSKEKAHLVEDPTSHMIIKRLFNIAKEKQDKTALTLGQAILNNKNVENIKTWIECNRGCFCLVNLIESSNDENKKKVKALLKDTVKELKEKTKSSGAKVLLEKLQQI